MRLTPGLRKLALLTHVTSSIGWLGGAAAYLALTIFALTSADPLTVRAAYLAMEPIARFALIPFAFASLLTGLVSSLGTHWGLFRHYWVIFKLLLTSIATVILVANLETVEALAGMAAETELPGAGGLTGQILHSGGGLLVLLITVTLGIYKPRGLTKYGWRKQNEENRPTT